MQLSLVRKCTESDFVKLRLALLAISYASPISELSEHVGTFLSFNDIFLRVGGSDAHLELFNDFVKNYLCRHVRLLSYLRWKNVEYHKTLNNI